MKIIQNNGQVHVCRRRDWNEWKMGYPKSVVQVMWCKAKQSNKHNALHTYISNEDDGDYIYIYIVVAKLLNALKSPHYVSSSKHRFVN